MLVSKVRLSSLEWLYDGSRMKHFFYKLQPRLPPLAALFVSWECPASRRECLINQKQLDDSFEHHVREERERISRTLCQVNNFLSRFFLEENNSFLALVLD
jgi:hypothetical protein